MSDNDVPSILVNEGNESDTNSEGNLSKRSKCDNPPHQNASKFEAAFADLKKSKFYEPPETVLGKESSTALKAVRSSSSKMNAVLVSPRQRGNPVLKSISNVPWEYEEILPDYVMGKTTCALFLSLRYHNLNPDYIHDRLKILGKQYVLRVLLVHVDTQDPHHSLKYLTRISILANLTLMLAWSPEEAGRIIETYKIFEHKPPDLIMERSENSPHQKLSNALTSIRSVNKTDASTLLSTFGSLEKIVKATPESLTLCPGLGPQKASRLHKVLHQPFLRDSSSVRKRGSFLPGN